MGQVVPEELGGDLRFVADGDKSYVEPVGKAKLYLLLKPLPEATPKKPEKLVIGDKFESRYFNGKYKLYDDGRRSGELVLKVDDDGSRDADRIIPTRTVPNTTSAARSACRNTPSSSPCSSRGRRRPSRAISSPATASTWPAPRDMNEREAGFFATRVEE